MIRVLLVDDQAMIRAGIGALLDLADGITVVGEAGDGATAVEMAARLRPDVVLMDIRMPGVDGIEATRRIAADPSMGGVHVVILTTFALDEYVLDALRLGAAGFLIKNSEPDELVRGVRAAARGDALLSPGVTRKLINEYAAHARAAPDATRAVGSLTDREREVVGLVAAGRSNDDIARELFISPLTAKTHVSRAMAKFGVRDRAQLVMLAYESGLARPGWMP